MRTKKGWGKRLLLALIFTLGYSCFDISEPQLESNQDEKFKNQEQVELEQIYDYEYIVCSSRG